jgi:hypothetical protein
LPQEDGITPTKAQEALQQVRNIVLAPQADDPEAQSVRVQEALSDAEAACRKQEEFTLLLLQKINMQSETAVEAERGRAETKVRTLEEKYAAYPLRKEEYQEKKASFGKELVVVSALLENLLAASHHLEVSKLPVLLNAPYEYDTDSPHELTLRAILNAAKDALENALAAMDEPGIRKTLEKDLSEQGKIEQQVESGETEVLRNQKAIETILTGRRLAHPSIDTTESLLACWPLIAAVSPDEESQVTNELEQARKELYAISQQVRSLTEELRHPGTPLDIDACQKKVDELQEERQICEWGAQFIQETRDRIARHVLPITERNMQPLLQQLTGGRYRDVRLTPDESNSQSSTVDYRIRVWDPTAGRYVAKNLFSGGTRDQCSLALRLAFALATLPQELGVAPGFIFLDEPLSAFDALRARALVELLTTGIIARQFNQVILISHSHAFDRGAFHYHVHMEGGQVVESNLPQEEPERDALVGQTTPAS